jgi:nicotinate phosphoribosyltransferase
VRSRPVPDQPLGPPLGLHTDLYELRMARTCLREGMTGTATFSLYIRPTPLRPWFLAAGIQRVLEVIAAFSYGPEELAYLESVGLGGPLIDWLAALEPRGEIWGVPEGTLVLADEPVLEVTAPLPQALLWETALLNVVQQSTLIATKAARCTLAAQGRTLVDFGFRRAQGLETGVEAARAAYLGGIGATSNVEAGRRYGIPVSGTMAHALIQAFGDERAAFSSFAVDHPDHAILLVDTYDTMDGVRNAIAVGRALQQRGHDLKGIRLDSGDLAALARESRTLLDDAGFGDTVILASGRMDEYRISELIAAGAPIDGFGVGTSLTVSADQPALDIVYKLVSYDGSPRAKYSEDKVLLPGPKQVYRDGSPTTDVLTSRDEPSPGGTPLLAPVWRDGVALCTFDLEDARSRAAAQLRTLPAEWQIPAGPDETPLPRVSDGLAALARAVRERDLTV